MTTAPLIPVSAARVDAIVEQVDLFRLSADARLDERRRAELGQFMTPAPTARFMASMLTCDTPDVVLLDPGAGVGSLLSTVVATLLQRAQPPRSIHVTAYEIDATLLDYLRETMKLCAECCGQAGVAFTNEIHATDFIAHTVDQLTNPLFSQHQRNYTYMCDPEPAIPQNSIHFCSAPGITLCRDRDFKFVYWISRACDLPATSSG